MSRPEIRWRRCETCDFHGPELPLQADLREFHRACHFIGRALVETLVKPTQADFTLAGPKR